MNDRGLAAVTCNCRYSHSHTNNPSFITHGCHSCALPIKASHCTLPYKFAHAVGPRNPTLPVWSLDTIYTIHSTAGIQDLVTRLMSLGSRDDDLSPGKLHARAWRQTQSHCSSKIQEGHACIAEPLLHLSLRPDPFLKADQTNQESILVRHFIKQCPPPRTSTS